MRRCVSAIKPCASARAATAVVAAAILYLLLELIAMLDECGRPWGQVIDLARVMREKHRLPTKTPLKSMMVVHSDAQFLADITGDLLPYVLEETNVREVHTCNDPMQYSSVKASPQWGALGKRVGKSMPQVKAAMQALTAEKLLAYEAGDTLDVAGFAMGPGDIVVVREFKMPPGRCEDELDAGGDGDVLVLLELKQDEALVQVSRIRRTTFSPPHFDWREKAVGFMIRVDKGTRPLAEKRGHSWGGLGRRRGGRASWSTSSKRCARRPAYRRARRWSSMCAQMATPPTRQSCRRCWTAMRRTSPNRSLPLCCLLPPCRHTWCLCCRRPTPLAPSCSAPWSWCIPLWPSSRKRYKVRRRSRLLPSSPSAHLSRRLLLSKEWWLCKRSLARRWG